MNKKIYNQADVDEWVRDNDEQDATELAYELCGEHIKKFAKAARELDRSFQKIRDTFPDANLFSADTGITLVLGDVHSEITGSRDFAKGQHQRIVFIKNMPGFLYLSGGCW